MRIHHHHLHHQHNKHQHNKLLIQSQPSNYLFSKREISDKWDMKMEPYLGSYDYPIWEVIQNGNGPVSVTTDTSEQIKILPPKTAEEIVARERERKARTTLLMAIPEDHLAKFHKMTDAKEMWNAIKSRFGGNENPKRCRTFVSENTSSTNDVSTAYGVSNTSGHNSKHEQTSSYSLLASQSSCPQLDHEDLDQVDEYDLEEMDLKWQVAMISMRIKKFYKKTGRKLQFDAKEPVGFDKTKVECYNCHKTGHFARECRTKEDNRRRDGWNPGNKDGSRTGKKEESKALVTVDGESVDWTTHSEDDENFAFMASNSSGSDTQVCSNECKESYANLKRLYDAQREQLSDASVEIKAYTQGLKKVEAQLVAHQQGQLWYEQKIKFMKIDLDDKTDVLTYHKKLLAKAQKEKDDLEVIVDKWNHSSKNLGKIVNYQMSASDKFSKEIDDSQYTYGPRKSQPSESESQTTELDTCDSNISTETSELVSEPVVNESNIEVQPKVWSDAPIIEEYESDSDDEHVCVQTKGLDTPSFANKQVKTPRENVKNQSTHSQKPKVNNKELGNGGEETTWNNVQRVNKQNQFVPLAVQTRTGNNPVNTAKASSTNNFSTARQNVNRQTVLTSTALKVNTVKPIVNDVRPANVFNKTHSPSSRPFKRTTVLRTNFSKQKVYTAKVKEVSTVGGKWDTAVKSSAGCKWRTPGYNNNILSKYNGGSSLRNYSTFKDPLATKPKQLGEQAYLAAFKTLMVGQLPLGGIKGYITGKRENKTGKLDFEDVSFVKELQPFNLFSVSQMCDKKNKVLFTDTECLVLSPDFKLPDENQYLLKVSDKTIVYSFNLENMFL
ncbi:ribonuclease H-like domain-containing protein [Tanacetum coccineum]